MVSNERIINSSGFLDILSHIVEAKVTKETIYDSDLTDRQVESVEEIFKLSANNVKHIYLTAALNGEDSAVIRWKNYLERVGRKNRILKCISEINRKIAWKLAFHTIHTGCWVITSKALVEIDNWHHLRHDIATVWSEHGSENSPFFGLYLNTVKDADRDGYDPVLPKTEWDYDDYRRYLKGAKAIRAVWGSKLVCKVKNDIVINLGKLPYEERIAEVTCMKLS